MSTKQPEAGDKRKAGIVEGGDPEASSTKQSRLKNLVPSGTSSGPVQDSSSKIDKDMSTPPGDQQMENIEEGCGEEASSTNQSRQEDDQSGIPSGSVKESGSKIFKDPVHGTITVTGLCVKIIDTPQFQRLRYLKQLGGGYFVYPGAAHNRFEHSIGTYYLAGTFARILQQEYPELEDDEITCIEIAGLCHDLGHGPFSHVFDNLFIPRVMPKRKWKHEDASVKMLEHLIDTNKDVKEAFKKFDPNGTLLELIKDLILGGKNSAIKPEGRVLEMRRKKPFLYEIVNNAQTGIDVDKWDYFARDCHMLGFKNNFDHVRYMKLARIILVGEEGGKVPRICARDKEAYNLYDMFHTRETLHRRACQHEVTRGVELMIVDALRLADKTVRITGSKRDYKISTCINDMEAYSHLNDNILQFVECPISLGTKNNSDTLEEARKIIRRIKTRDLYKCVGQYTLTSADPLAHGDNKKEMKKIKKKIRRGEKMLEDEEFDITLMSFDYGKEEGDPLAKAWFYKKSEPEKAFHLSEEKKSRMLPKRFQERGIAIYSKKKEFEEEIQRRFEHWSDARKKEFPEDKGKQGQMPEVSSH